MKKELPPNLLSEFDRVKLGAEHRLDIAKQLKSYLPSKMVWRIKQGEPGFVAYSKQKLRELLGNDYDADNKYTCGGKDKFALSPAQKVTATLTLPPSHPCRRLLINAPVGFGKTLMMIYIMQNYFKDNRKIILIFPTSSVAENFYVELLKFPNQHKEALQVSMTEEMTIENVTEELALKGKLHQKKTLLNAPVRAFSYAEAGGYAAFGKTRNAVFNWKSSGSNPYNNSIVLLDEFHNVQKMDQLKKALTTATNCDLFGFTATTFNDTYREHDALMEVVKGETFKDYSNSDGFLVSFIKKPTSIFPEVLTGDPQTCMPKMLTVVLKGHNRKIYMQKRKELQRIIDPDQRNIKLSAYCNLSTHYTQINRHNWMKKFLLDPKSYATKLAACAQFLKRDNHNLQTLIMISKEDGFLALLELLLDQKSIGMAHEKCDKMCLTTFFDKKKAFSHDLETYNIEESNLALANTTEFSEGVSFKRTRTLVMVDVPQTVSSYIQITGRALRSCGHFDLPPEERNVDIVMFVGTVPDITESADQYLVKNLERKLKEHGEIQRIISRESLN